MILFRPRRLTIPNGEDLPVIFLKFRISRDHISSREVRQDIGAHPQLGGETIGLQKKTLALDQLDLIRE